VDRPQRTSDASTGPQHGAEILAAWRDAERRLAAAPPEAADAICAEVIRLRAAYHDWMEATVGDPAGDRAPQPDRDPMASTH
jgi:hypothetical protein